MGITQQSTSRWIWWCQKDRIITIQQLTLVHGWCAQKGCGPSLTHRPDPTANPTISSASVPRQRLVPNGGKQTTAPLSSLAPYTVVTPVVTSKVVAGPGGVFICMLQTRVTLTAFPIATPRGRSSKFPWRELLNYSNVSRCNWLPPPLKITYCIPTLTNELKWGA